MRFLIVFFLLFVGCFGYSQVSKDTSYTISSEYKKELRKFPYIEKVKVKSQMSVAEQKDIVYYSVESRKLHLDAFIYKSEKVLPAVILIHGGGWKSGDKSMLHPLAQQIALSGYQCFTVEYRLSDEAVYPAAIEDVLQAIKYVKNNAEKFNVDKTKIAILGCSSGAQMASLIGTKFSEDIKAVVNIDGILAFHHPESEEGKLASLWLGGTYDEIPDVWKDASALSHVSSKTPPILFINSQYKRFHAGRDDMIEKLNQYKIYSRIELIEGSPHTFWLFHPWFEKITHYITQFLNEKLKS